MLCFCSLLYYKGLSEQIRRFNIQKKQIMIDESLQVGTSIKIKDFVGRLSISEPSDVLSHLSEKYKGKKSYKKLIVNRWHLYLMMEKNKQLIYYRKYRYAEKKKKEKENFTIKVKSIGHKLSCNCKKNGNITPN